MKMGAVNENEGPVEVDETVDGAVDELDDPRVPKLKAGVMEGDADAVRSRGLWRATVRRWTETQP